jgi:hypothetical protein
VSDERKDSATKNSNLAVPSTPPIKEPPKITDPRAESEPRVVKFHEEGEKIHGRPVE